MPKRGCSMACTLVPIYRRRWPPPLSTQASRRGPALRWIHLALPRLSASPLAAWLHPSRLHPRASLPRARRAALAALLAQAAPTPAAEPARRRAAKGANAVRGLGVARCSTCAGYVARLGAGESGTDHSAKNHGLVITGTVPLGRLTGPCGVCYVGIFSSFQISTFQIPILYFPRDHTSLKYGFTSRGQATDFGRLGAHLLPGAL